MKAGLATLALAFAGSALAQDNAKAAAAKSAAKFGPAQLKASAAPNAIGMDKLKQKKLKTHEAQREAGAFDMDRYEAQNTAVRCVDGKAGEYSCNNVDMLGFLRHQDLGSSTREGNDVWGWTAANGREFGIVGQTDGVGFVEVKKDGSLVYMGRLNTHTVPSIWRDMKVIKDHVYIGSEAPDHGLQIFNLNKLLSVDPESPPSFSTSSDVAGHFSGFGSSHNIVANEETNMIYAVGTARNLPGGCRGGLYMVDVSNPAKPQDLGCYGGEGYVHDAQCVIYNGPQRAYQGLEICFCYNESHFTIVDVTRKNSPRFLSRTYYAGSTYTHQGWLANDDMTYVLLDDELDELEGTGPAADQRTTTYVVDIQDLRNPVFRSVYKSPQKSIDHNQYVIDGISYQSNYGSGLRIVDVSSVKEDDTAAGFEELGFFDCHPEDDEAGGEAEFFGAWSVYPYFKSGHILLNSIERGIYSLKQH